MLIAEGGILLLAGTARMPRSPKMAKRIRRVMFITGAMLFSLAILDRLALLPGSASSEGLVELVPFINQAWLFQLLVAFIGMMLMRGPKYRESEFAEVQQSRRAKVDENRLAFVHAHRNSSTEGHSRLARPNTPHADPFEPVGPGDLPVLQGPVATAATRLEPCDGETPSIPERWPRGASFSECLSSLVRDDGPEVQFGPEGWDVPQGTRDG